MGQGALEGAMDDTRDGSGSKRQIKEQQKNP